MFTRVYCLHPDLFLNSLWSWLKKFFYYVMKSPIFPEIVVTQRFTHLINLNLDVILRYSINQFTKAEVIFEEQFTDWSVTLTLLQHIPVFSVINRKLDAGRYNFTGEWRKTDQYWWPNPFLSTSTLFKSYLLSTDFQFGGTRQHIFTLVTYCQY